MLGDSDGSGLRPVHAIERDQLTGGIDHGDVHGPAAPLGFRFHRLDQLAGIFRINKSVNLATEVNGRANTRGGGAPLGTESQGEFRMGVQVKAAGIRFDAAGIKGLTRFSPKTGITFGITYDTPTVFAPVK